ncbi:hypothetical protein EVAR_81771_1 [Eumeta japonica]|uniref:Uncharacterized protein n=1 Tax=Eumeta variegata TaxID=151549 RepID=A0A4C1UHJ2_EUMVA|nr:hypothetical protein EVAR_81771_1 [Eumeta japonica]
MRNGVKKPQIYIRSCVSVIKRRNRLDPAVAANGLSVRSSADADCIGRTQGSVDRDRALIYDPLISYPRKYSRGNQQANHQRVDGHRRPWILVSQRSHQCVASISGRNKTSAERELMKREWAESRGAVECIQRRRRERPALIELADVYSKARCKQWDPTTRYPTWLVCDAP